MDNVIKIAFECDNLSTPEELDAPNSPYSVEMINSRVIPWLKDVSSQEGSIWAGDSIKKFMDVLDLLGGKIYTRFKRE